MTCDSEDFTEWEKQSVEEALLDSLCFHSGSHNTDQGFHLLNLKRVHRDRYLPFPSVGTCLSAYWLDE